MDPARWGRVQELFHRAAGLQEPERSAFLAEASGDDDSRAADVRGMLEADGRAALVDRDVTGIADQVLVDSASAALKECGPYRICRLLGEGGMGAVYLAERKDLGNFVAFKVLRDAWRSPARRQRFLMEQRTLAQLNHSSVARLYDAATLTDGTPWFVMEYVDGLPVTEYCRRHQCSIDSRLKLVRTVAEAVQYAHDHGVIHRDLKPSNILVKEDGSVRLVDFGIAKQLDASGRPVSHTLTAFRSLTLAYASPEQIRGGEASKSTDIYSLGVVLYELLADRLPFDLTGKSAAEAEQILTTEEPARPSKIARQKGEKASWRDLDALCLTALQKDTGRRYPSVAEFVHDIDRYLNRESLGRPAGLVRRSLPARWSAVFATLLLLGAAAGLTLTLARKPPLPASAQTVAVLPFRNASSDRGLDFLSVALADEVSRTLGYARSLSIRPAESARKYAGPGVNLQTAGRELRAATIVSGEFLQAGSQLQVTLDLTDVEKNRLIWTDVFEAPAHDLMAVQGQIAFKTRRAVAPLLGVSEFVTDNPPRPKNEEAYQAYLRAMAMPEEISTDPVVRKRIVDLLNRSLALDSSYAPAWEALAWHYANDGWFGNGGDVAMGRFHELSRKIVALDPDNIIFRAGVLYYAALGRPDGGGGISRVDAYREIERLLRSRPDNARLHFLASWILRDVGLLEDSSRECDTAVLIDAQDAGARSCGVTFMLRGNYQRAWDFLNLDRDSEVSRAVGVDVLVRQGRVTEALQRMHEKTPPWGAYGVLRARLEQRPAPELEALARQVQPASDPEINFFSAAHLAYAHQSDAALALLKQAIAGGYCSYPDIDSNPFFAAARGKPEFAQIRLAAQRCQHEFQTQRSSGAKR